MLSFALASKREAVEIGEERFAAMFVESPQ
jgi:hypothetical protein